MANICGEEFQQDERIEDNVVVDGAVGSVPGEEPPSLYHPLPPRRITGLMMMDMPMYVMKGL